jgi:hypothetical protein
MSVLFVILLLVGRVRRVFAANTGERRIELRSQAPQACILSTKLSAYMLQWSRFVIKICS